MRGESDGAKVVFTTARSEKLSDFKLWQLLSESADYPGDAERIGEVADVFYRRGYPQTARALVRWFELKSAAES